MAVDADAVEALEAVVVAQPLPLPARSQVIARPIVWLEHAAMMVVVSAMAVELVVMFGNVALRNTTGRNWLWSPDVGQVALAVIAFIGGPLSYRRGRQPALTFLGTVLPDALKPLREATVDLLVVAIPAALAGYCWPAIQASQELHTYILNLPYTYLTVPVLVGMIMFSIFALDRFVRHDFRTIVASAAIVGLIVLAGWGLVGISAQSSTYAFSPAAMVIAFAFLLLIGVPISVVFLASSGFYIVNADLPLSVATSNLSGGVDSFILLAIPFFVLAGLIMLEAGLSARIAAFAETLVRRFPGGLLHVVVVTMYIFSGLSGSKSADMAAVGSAMERPMRKHGIKGGEIAAVLAASAIMGETIPPCLTLLILGSVTDLSISALFLGGILPAAVLAILLIAVISFRATRRGERDHVTGEPIRRQRAPVKEMASTGLVAFPALVVPAVLVVGIATGFASPTEVSSVSVVLALVLAVGYRAPLRAYKAIAMDSATLGGMVLFFVTSAHALSWGFTNSDLPQRLATTMNNFSHSSWLFMLATLIFIPVMGLALEGIAAILIFAPLLMPTAQALGINTLQYGLVLVIAMSMGAFAPPIGWLMYEACTICRVRPEETMRPLLSYYTVLVPGLFIIAFVPILSLLLPHLFLGMPLH